MTGLPDVVVQMSHQRQCYDLGPNSSYISACEIFATLARRSNHPFGLASPFLNPLKHAMVAFCISIVLCTHVEVSMIQLWSQSPGNKIVLHNRIGETHARRKNAPRSRGLAPCAVTIWILRVIGSLSRAYRGRIKGRMQLAEIQSMRWSFVVGRSRIRDTPFPVAVLLCACGPWR